MLTVIAGIVIWLFIVVVILTFFAACSEVKEDKTRKNKIERKPHE